MRAKPREPGTLFAKPTKPKPIAAPEILELLRQRHAEDVFIPECKTGPSQGVDHSRFDAWVMKKSWANAATIGYEIKVTRSDFLRDDKWPNYLPFCNSLYFVAPRTAILPSEMPEGVGLLTVGENGGRLMTARKAAYRQIAEPAALLRYVLMCRATIVEDRTNGGFKFPDRAERTERWRQWLDEKKSAREVGYLVAKALKKRIEGELQESAYRANDAERKCEDMAGRLGMLADVERWIQESGLAWQLRGVTSAERFREIFEAKTGQSAAALARELSETAGRLARLAERLKEEEPKAPAVPAPVDGWGAEERLYE